MDHDFLKGEGRERPFAPPPERPILHWLSALLVLLALAYAGYRVVDPWNDRPPAAAIKQAPAISNQTIKQSSERPPQASTPSVLDHETRTVTKCVINGKTSYGDGSCATGGATTQVITKTDQNLLAAVRPQPPVQTEEQPRQTAVVTKNETMNAAAGIKNRCAALEAQITSLDAMGRQPQTLQTYDWIRDERKKTRDEQFRIPCR